MPEISPTCGIPYHIPGETENTHNQAISIIDALLMPTIKDRDLNSPPGSPSDGDCYLVASGGSGDWDGQDGLIAIYIDNDWYSGWWQDSDGSFIQPQVGMRAFVEDEDRFILYDGTSWIPWDNHIRKSSDTARSADTTTSDDPHLQAAVAANRNYTWEASLFVIGPANADVKVAVNYPAGASVVYGGGICGGAGSSFFVTDDDTDSGTIPLGGTTWPDDAIFLLLSGTLAVGSTAGTFAIQWAQDTSQLTATTVKAGSFLTVNLAAA